MHYMARVAKIKELAKEERIQNAHEEHMKDDINYAIKYLDIQIGLTQTLSDLKKYCTLYEMDMDRILDTVKDTL